MKVIAMYSIKMRASHEDIHISGAETMCEFKDLENYLKKIELMSRELNVNVFVTIHGDVKIMPENIKKYVA